MDNNICRKSNALTSISMVVILGIVTLLTLNIATPPNVVSKDAPAEEFSAERAAEHWNVIAQKPKPMGSEEHEKVKQYLVDQLISMDIEVSVENYHYVLNRELQVNSPVHNANISNIVARIPGTNNTDPIILMGTYATMPTTPGAADTSTGVVTIIETIRAIKAGPPLKNDIYILFNDADEYGMMGSFAFVNNSPVFKDCKLAMTFTGAGSNGPSYLTFVSIDKNNGWLLSEALKVAPHPFISSFFMEMSSRALGCGELPAFSLNGKTTLGAMFFNNHQVYHAMVDNPNNLDKRSLQHSGSYALAFTRHFGNMENITQEAPNIIAFNILKDKVITYPAAWSLPLAILCLVLFLAVLFTGFRNKKLSFRGILLGFLIIPINLILSSVVVGALWTIIRKIGNFQFFLGVYNSYFFVIAFAFLVIGLTWFTISKVSTFKNITSKDQLLPGQLLWWLLLSLLTGLVLPGLSYVFIWPLLFVLIFTLIKNIFPSIISKASSHLIILTICAIPAILFFIPLLKPLFEITLRLEFAMLIVAAWVPFLFVALLVGLLTNVLEIIENGKKYLLGKVGLGLGILLLIIGIIMAGYSPDQPRPNYMSYVLDGKAQKAYWYSPGDKPDAWTKQFYINSIENTTFEIQPYYAAGIMIPAIKTEAPLAKLSLPEIKLISSEVNGNTRTLILKATSTRNAPYLNITATPTGKINNARINGVVIDKTYQPGEAFKTFSYAISTEGIEIVLEVDSITPIKFEVTDYTHGLPEIPGMNIKPRPADMMIAPYDFYDPTIVTNSFEF